jgi:tRNA A-37 threonylcarbamoyl transferase component Bud32
MICAVAEVPAQLEEVGRTIAGRYRVDAVLGRGGMGAVYRVADVRSGKALALKRGFGRTPLRASRRQALLEREYHTLAQLAHPRIIEVYDYGVDELGPYYTMELLDGQDLDASGKLPWMEACALLCDVASSLAILHSRGLLHRDVSARNVRRTADGHAKLIDFGAMTSIGLAKSTVGTPPFVAPEALQMQALDARADLFSLGALGYYLLTGRHAYYARRLSELRDVWRTRPRALSRLLPDAPPALNALIMQMLALDRGTRPQSAAEVMERLCAIASLPRKESVQTSRAYLTMPTLVGRDRAMILTRRRMLSLARGDGGALLIDGVPGSGRSRLLDACVLEAKLLGATVARASASDGENREWGVARSLGAQLIALLPHEAADAARLSQPVLGHVLDHFATPQVSGQVRVPDRSLLIRELRDFILALSREQRLMIAVDDADCIDEPSLALLASLAHKTSRHPLILAIAVERDSRFTDSPALRLLRSLSDPIELDLLQPADTEALVRSVFGDVRNLSAIAARIHDHAHGSPLSTMELAQHFVDRGIARYEAGSWLLPEDIDEADMPSSLLASLDARVAPLSADALELCQALCLAEGDALTLGSYPSLTDHCNQKRVFAALDELVSARILVADSERYHFSQRGFVTAVGAGIAPERRKALHARLADVISFGGGDALRRAHHLLHGGEEREAIELLCGMDLIARPLPLSLLERAMLEAERLELPALTVHRLRMAVLSRAPFVQELNLFRRYAPRVLERLSADCGLSRYAELGDLPPDQRLARALTHAQQRYLATPERDRLYTVPDAMRELTRVIAAAISVAVLSYDIDFLDTIPSLEPLLPIAPAMLAVCQMHAAARLLLRGCFGLALAAYQQNLARLSEPDRAGLDATQHARMYLGINYLLGLLEASMGMASAERRAQVLETERELRVNAWRVRQLLHLNQGNVDEARVCQRRAELLQLQDPLAERYGGTSTAYELRAYSRVGDLLRVKGTVDAANVMAEKHVGWRPIALSGQCRFLQLKGDAAGALALLERSFGDVRPGHHVFWAFLAAIHVEVLNELGRGAEAIALARRYLAIQAREELTTPDHALHVAAAYALARGGEHAEALALLQVALDAGERGGQLGLALGVMYEARARIAIWMNDRAAFETFSERCAAQFSHAKNAALGGRIERLLEEAHKQDLELGPLELAPEAHGLIVSGRINTEREIIYSRMRECLDDADRARCALSLLLQGTDSSAGYLYGVGDTRIELLAALPEAAHDERHDAAMQRWLSRCVEAELSIDARATGSGTGTEDQEEAELGVNARFVDEDGRTFEAILLVAQEGVQPRIAAVLALHVRAGARSIPPREIRTEIAEQLLEHGDVEGVALNPRLPELKTDETAGA